MRKVNNNNEHVTDGVMDEEQIRVAAAGSIFLVLVEKYTESHKNDDDDDFSHRIQKLCHEIARMMEK